MKIALIAGTRPNFIKAGPVLQALRRFPEIQTSLINTGQHHNSAMSTDFLMEMGLPEPDIAIPGKSNSILQETSRISLGLEPVLTKIKPDWVLVIGDVTSTLAGALAAKQLGMNLAHIEAGLRSADRTMPEELNRIAVDHLSDALFASEESGVKNLQAEGIASEHIFFPGNVLIDAMHCILPRAKKLESSAIIRAMALPEQAVKMPKSYGVATFHRPSNVDELQGLQRLVDLLHSVSCYLPVVFPAHPRTWANLLKHNLAQELLRDPAVIVLQTLNHAQMICMMLNARLVVTDSGGIQEETTCLGVPCFTMRRTTERPATVAYGTNTLISDLEISSLNRQIELLLAGKYKTSAVPPFWDGQAAERIVSVLRLQVIGRVCT